MIDLFGTLAAFQPMIQPVIEQLIMPLIQLHGTVGSAMGPGTVANEEFCRLRNETLKRTGKAALGAGKLVGRAAKAAARKAAKAASRLRRRKNADAPRGTAAPEASVNEKAVVAAPSGGRGKGRRRTKRDFYAPAPAFTYPEENARKAVSR